MARRRSLAAMAEKLVGAGSRLLVPDEDHTHGSGAFDRP